MAGMELTGKVAVVTGSSSLSRSAASALAEAGADIVLATGDTAHTAEVDRFVGVLGKRSLLVPTMLTDLQSFQELAEKVISTFGKIDILVNGGGKEFAKPCLETGQEEWHKVLNSNLTAAFFACQAVGKHMLRAKRGTIINLISGLSARAAPNYSAYCAAMGGIHQFSRALSLEWARKGIRIN